MADTSVFLKIPKENWVMESESFFVLFDQFPVSPGHCLIVTKEVRKDYFELTELEKAELVLVITKTKERIEEEYQPDGYNIGMNCGAAAGQTVFHFHCHIIPRYKGDMEDPRGGVRYCIPTKGRY